MPLYPRTIERLKTFENKSYETEFGIENNDNEKLTIHTSKFNQNKIGLHIRYKYKNKTLDFLNLPKEISRNISNFLDQYIDISIDLTYPNDYPFKEPKWSLTNINYNIDRTTIPLKEYYNYLIEKHNETYRHYWTPAIKMDKDILAFIGKINHFEYLLLKN